MDEPLNKTKGSYIIFVRVSVCEVDPASLELSTFTEASVTPSCTQSLSKRRLLRMAFFLYR